MKILVINCGSSSLKFQLFNENELTQDGVFLVDENRDGTLDYSFPDPDFNFLQFRSNLVIRWEYKPGSSLFLVWSQGRTGYLPIGEYTMMDNMQEMFDVYPHNVFLIKFSYGFNL